MPVCPVRVEGAELLSQVLSNSLGATYSYSCEPSIRKKSHVFRRPGLFLSLMGSPNGILQTLFISSYIF